MDSSATISEPYLQQQRELHKNPHYGEASLAFASLVKDLLRRAHLTSLADYGAGKQNLKKQLDVLEAPAFDYRPYDPAFPDYGPPRAADLVCCIDVLEHIEPDRLDAVLADLERITTKLGFFTIHTGAAFKVLADGRNAHLIQEPASWWLPRLRERFEVRHVQPLPKGFWVIVEPRGRSQSAIDAADLTQLSNQLPIRVFIGSSLRNRVEERVFVRSLEERTRHPLEIHVIDGMSGTVTLHSGETLSPPAHVPHDLGGVTAFSLGRFAIPHWCGYRGRAIYCDSDQLAFADIAQLWHHDMAGAGACAVHVRDAISAPAYVDHMLGALRDSDDDLYLASVMLLDCEKLRAWDLAAIVRSLRRKDLSYVQALFLSREFRSAFATSVGRLDPTWNCLDVLRPDTKVLHFTDLTSQPWRYPHNPTGEVWDREFLRAARDGLISRAELQEVRATGFISRRVRSIVDVPEPLRASVNRGWRLVEQAGHRAEKIAKRAARAVERRIGVADRVAWQAFSTLEDKVIPGVPGRVQKLNPRGDRIAGVGKVLAWRLASVGPHSRPEVTAFVYSAACERVLVPIVLALAAEHGARAHINVVTAQPISEHARTRLLGAGCHVERVPLSLMRAAEDPAHNVVLLCLDHRLHYAHHRYGVDVADWLRARGVKTMCMQHGGCRGDSVASLASSASDRLLVWGEATRRMLVERHGVSSERIAVVGNPLHDGILGLDRERVLTELAARRPGLAPGRDGRKVVVMATTIQGEYLGYPDEQERYARYVSHVYASLDFARMILIIKAHPCDPTGARNLYEQLRSRAADPDSVLVIPADDRVLDVYSLLAVADLLLTRCSTVAEEALLVGKKVVAFDLEPEGLSQHYQHLDRLGDYRTVYESPPEALARAVVDALFSGSSDQQISKQETEREITFALDGQSARRAATAVWRELQTQAREGATCQA